METSCGEGAVSHRPYRTGFHDPVVFEDRSGIASVILSREVTRIGVQRHATDGHVVIRAHFLAHGTPHRSRTDVRVHEAAVSMFSPRNVPRERHTSRGERSATITSR